jgi:hypothetical protein
MEFEKVVANELEKLGYPVFYRNFKIMYNRCYLSEFDIISYDFIVEVKSGKDSQTKGLNLMHSHNILPKQFKYYIYCHILSDEEIHCLNTHLARGNILYINSLSTIQKFHNPMRDIHISSESAFCNFLNLPMSSIKKFNKVYMSSHIYVKTYTRAKFERDRYSFTDNMTWSQKIDYLFNGQILSLKKDPPPNVPNMIIKKSIRNKVILKRLEHFTIPIFYTVNFMQKDKDMVDIYF